MKVWASLILRARALSRDRHECAVLRFMRDVTDSGNQCRRHGKFIMFRKFILFRLQYKSMCILLVFQHFLSYSIHAAEDGRHEASRHFDSTGLNRASVQQFGILNTRSNGRSLHEDIVDGTNSASTELNPFVVIDQDGFTVPTNHRGYPNIRDVPPLTRDNELPRSKCEFSFSQP